MFPHCLELRRLREQAPAMSQADMAEACGVSRLTINQIEQGKRIPSPEVLDRWLNVRGLRPSDVPQVTRSVFEAHLRSNPNLRGILALQGSVEQGQLVHECLSILREYAPNLPEETLDYVGHRIRQAAGPVQ